MIVAAETETDGRIANEELIHSAALAAANELNYRIL